jgi:hypothetical protein
MSLVFARTVPPALPAAALSPPPVPPLLALEPELVESEDLLSDPHAVSATASPAVPTAATTVRRAGVGTG